MPILNVDVLSKCDVNQKNKLIEDLIKSTHVLLGIPAEKIVVVINEPSIQNWGRAGVVAEHQEFASLSRRKLL